MRVLALAAVLLAPAAAAQVACDPDGPQQAMNACARDDFQAADAALNRVYQGLMRDAAPAMKERIRAAQRAWIPFRDAHCAVEADLYEGGSIQPLIRYGCLAETTKRRTAELRAYREIVDF